MSQNLACQVLTGSGWETVLYNCMQADENSYLAIPFILSFYFLSNYFILNLFIGAIPDFHSLAELFIPPLCPGAILDNMDTRTEHSRRAYTVHKRVALDTQHQTSRAAQLFVNSLAAWDSVAPNGQLASIEEVFAQPVTRRCFVPSMHPAQRFGIPVNNISLNLFGPHSRFRRVVQRVAESNWFNVALVTVICYSTFTLTLLNPTTLDDDWWKQFFFINDVIFLIVFTVEFLVKVDLSAVCHCLLVCFLSGDSVWLLVVRQFGAHVVQAVDPQRAHAWKLWPSSLHA